jgi:hypothetical protein
MAGNLNVLEGEARAAIAGRWSSPATICAYPKFAPVPFARGRSWNAWLP